ncbi:MAG: hypothetical protein WKG00_11765 [Polyangiaceae bacterium]
MLPSTEDCTNALDDDCDGIACSACLWSRTAGDASHQTLTASAVDDDQNIYVVGVFDGTIDLGGAPLIASGLGDILVAKLDEHGDVLWARNYGSAQQEGAYGVSVTSSGIAIVGYFEKNLTIGAWSLAGAPGERTPFVASISAAGEPHWAVTVDGVEDAYAFAVGPLPDDALMVAGSLRTSKPAPLPQAIFVRRLAKDGATEWTRIFESAYEQYATAAATDPVGNIFVAVQGRDEIKLDAWTIPPPDGDDRLALAKLDAEGQVAWVQTVDGSYDGSVSDLFTTATGSVALAGSFIGTLVIDDATLSSSDNRAAFVTMLTSGGIPIWTRSFGDATAFAAAVAVDPNDRVVVAGGFTGEMHMDTWSLASAGEDDFFLASLEPTGEVRWAKRFGDKSFQIGGELRLSVDKQGYILSTGDFLGTVDFGAGPHTAQGSDLYIAKHAP